MKAVFIYLFFLLFSVPSYAQFPGHYIVQTGLVTYPEIHFVLQKNGSFRAFCGEMHGEGIWRSAVKNKAELKITKVNPVNLFVFSGKKYSGQVYFHGFGDKETFFSIGKEEQKNKTFRPVYKEQPQCPYDEDVSIDVPRDDFNTITIGANTPYDPIGTEKHVLYTYRIPEEYEGVYMVVEGIAFLKQKIMTVEYKDDKYLLDDKEGFEKEPGELFLAEVLASQMKAVEKARIDKLKQQHRWLKECSMEMIQPEITCGIINRTDSPVFTVDCPEADPFPPIDPKMSGQK